MSRPIQDPVILAEIKKSVRYDFANTDLTVDEIAIKNNCCRRSVYTWSKGLKRDLRKSNRYTTIMLTDRELTLLLIAIQEYTKIAKGDWIRRSEIMEDRLATVSEELQKRRCT